MRAGGGSPSPEEAKVTTAPAMVPDMNWFAVLAHHAARSPDKPMTVFEGRTITYGEMAGRAIRLAGGLAAHGVGGGDVVGLLSYNCPEFLEAIFAANYLGAVAMPINWRLAAPEVRYILEHSGARALVVRRLTHRSGRRGHRRHRGHPDPGLPDRLRPERGGPRWPICAPRPMRW